MGAFDYIITWMFLASALGFFGIWLITESKLRDMKDYADYVSGNNAYFGERMEDRNKEVDNLHQDITYYLSRLAHYKAFLAEKDMVEAFIHWRPTINAKAKSVPPWEDDIDSIMDEIRLPDRSSGAKST